MRQRKAKKFASALALAEKECIIENLESKVLDYESKLRKRKKITASNMITKPQKTCFDHQTSVGDTSMVVATQGKRHFGISKARQSVLTMLSGIF